MGVLLCHGFTATTAEVRQLARALHEQNFTVSGPLLSGHGSHPADLNRVSWRDWLACAEAAYRALAENCSRVVVGGESMGGLLALMLASRHPEIAAVMAFAPALRLTTPRLNLMLLPLIAPFHPYQVKKVLDGNPYWQGYPVNPTRGVLQLLHLQKQVYRRLPQIRQPLLIIQGRLDETVHASTPQFIASRVNSKVKEVHWLDRSAHVVILDQEWEQAAALTLAFLRKTLAL